MTPPGKQVVTLWFGTALLPQGWADRVRVSLSHGRIVRVEAEVDAAPADERHAVALPGMPNVHSHAFQRAMAGLTESRGAGGHDSFWTWRELMYRFVARLTPEHVEALSAQAFMEMLEAGFTRVGEFHYLHHAPDGTPYSDIAELAARVASAAADTGIALTLLPVFYAHAGFGGLDPAPAQRRFVTSIEQFAALLEASRRAVARLDHALVGVAPHSLRAVTPHELHELTELARDVPIHMHVAEQEREVVDCLAWSGQRPVAWLLEHSQLDAHWCLVHATHMVPSEIEALSRTGAVAGLCPITEANLGDGIFPGAAWHAAGGRIGVGSDSNVLIDPAEELRLLEYGQRLAHRSRNLLASDGRSTGRNLFELALAGGAQSLAGGAAALAAGEPADIVTLDTMHDALLERSGDALLDAWVFVAGKAAIDCVWRAGRKVVKGGRHVERARIGQRFAEALGALLQ